MAASRSLRGMYPLLGAVRAVFRSKAQQSRKPWRKKANVQEQVRLGVPIESARRRCAEVLSAVGEPRPASDPNVMEAVTALNSRSSGTVVRIELQSMGDATEALITAWPGAQLFDWGESRRTVQEVSARLGGHS
jgi:hypothetical protein